MPEISEDLLLGQRAHSREQVGSVRNRDLGGPQEGPGQGDLLRFADAQFHATLELVVPEAVVALLEGAD